MALIECPDCHASISTSAPSCPHCGRPADPSMWVVRAGDGAEFGPLTEAEVIDTIRDGVPPDWSARRTTSEDWIAVTDHPPFAAALKTASDGQRGQKPGPVHVQTTKGSAFLDPGSNARSCCGVIAFCFIGSVALFVLMAMMGTLQAC